MAAKRVGGGCVVVVVEQKMVQCVVVVAIAAGGDGGRGVAEVDDEIEVPVAEAAVRGDLVEGGMVGRGVDAGQARLLRLGEEAVSAIAVGHGGDGWFGGIVLRRRAGQEIAAGAGLVSRVVRQEILQQPRRCLACSRRGGG